MYLMNNYMNLEFPTLALDEVGTIEHSTLCVLLNEAIEQEIYSYYKHLLKAIRMGNKIILITTNPARKVDYLLYNLLIANGQYNLYVVEPDLLDTDYLDKVGGMDCTLQDIESFIDQDTTYYATTHERLLELNSYIEAHDTTAVQSFIETHGTLFPQTIETLNYFKGCLEYYIGLEQDRHTQFVGEPFDFPEEIIEEVGEKRINLSKEGLGTDFEIEPLVEPDNIEDLTEELSDPLTDQLVELMALKEALEEQISQLTMANDDLAAQLDAVETAKTDLSDQVTQLISAKGILEIQLEELTAELDAAKSQPGMSEANSEVLKDMEDKVSALEHQRNELLEQVESLKVQVSATTTLVQEHDRTISQLRNTNESLETTIGDKQKEVDQLKATQSEIENTNRTEINQLKTELEALRSQEPVIQEVSATAPSGDSEALTAELDAIKQQLTEAEAKLNTYKQEIVTLKTENDDYVHKLNFKAPTITTYSPIRLSSIRLKTKTILYFKEISYVSYTNTLITVLLDTMTRARIKTKLVIYDNPTHYNVAYNNVTHVTSTDYLKNKDHVLNQADRIVVTEHSTMILEDILKAEFDLVIIYDRLKNDRDLIMSGTYTKFWVINSRSGIVATQGLQSEKTKIPPENIITRPGVLQGTIALPEIAEYRNSTPSAKLSNWFGLCNVNSPSQAPIIPTIATKAGISLKIRSR